MASGPAGDAGRERFLRLLAEAERRSCRLSFWWRDDDAETVTPDLERLLQLAKSHDLPLALAVVPKRATEDLAQRLLSEPKVMVLQHGWSHRNHASAGERKIELGDHRPFEEVASDLRAGFERLSRLFGEKFCPVLVPPWNRISTSVQGATKPIGLKGLSAFGPAAAGEPHQVNTHLDIFAWKPERRPLSRGEAYAALNNEIERRCSGEDEPLGILTHHLVHQRASWDFLDELLGLIARHPAVHWPAIGELFELRPL